MSIVVEVARLGDNGCSRVGNTSFASVALVYALLTPTESVTVPNGSLQEKAKQQQALICYRDLGIVLREMSHSESDKNSFSEIYLKYMLDLNRHNQEKLSFAFG